jgi:hypothetical protein
MIIKDLPNPKHSISIVRLLYVDEFYRFPFPFPFPDRSTPINSIDVDEYVTDIDINSPLNITNYIKYNLSISGSVETKTIICDPIIYLTANVIGNPINHTFLWEEVTNTNVSIFTVDNFNTYYINSPPVDRVIRFYIDKGTVDEQFKEISNGGEVGNGTVAARGECMAGD